MCAPKKGLIQVFIILQELQKTVISLSITNKKQL